MLARCECCGKMKSCYFVYDQDSKIILLCEDCEKKNKDVISS